MSLLFRIFIQGVVEVRQNDEQYGLLQKQCAKNLLSFPVATIVCTYVCMCVMVETWYFLTSELDK